MLPSIASSSVAVERERGWVSSTHHARLEKVRRELDLPRRRRKGPDAGVATLSPAKFHKTVNDTVFLTAHARELALPIKGFCQHPLVGTKFDIGVHETDPPSPFGPS